MEATVVINDINNALKKISSCVNSETVTLKSKNGKLQIISGTKESYLGLAIVNSTCEKGFIFTINKQIFSGILKNRKGSLTFTLNKKQHSVEFVDKGNKYKGSLTCIPDNVEEVKVPEEGNSILIPTNLQKELQKMIKAVQLHDMIDKHELDVHIKLSPSGLTLNTFDSVHVAKFSSKETTKKEAVFTMLGSTFGLIADIANDKKYTLKFTRGQVYAENEDFTFSSALIQAETSVTLKQVTELLDSLSKPTTSITVNVKDFYQCMENIVAIHESKGSFDFVINKGKLKLRNSSNFGKIEDLIKAEVQGKDGVYAIDPHLLDDILQCVTSKDIVLNLTPNKYLSVVQKLKLGRASYICNLSG